MGRTKRGGLKGRPGAGSKVKPALLVAGNGAATLPAEILLRICSYLEAISSMESKPRSYILPCLLVNRHWCSVFVPRIWYDVLVRKHSNISKINRALQNPERSFMYNAFMRNFTCNGNVQRKGRRIYSSDLKQIIDMCWTTLHSLHIQAVPMKLGNFSTLSETPSSTLSSLTLSYCAINVNILIDFVKATSCLRKFTLVLCNFVMDEELNGRAFQDRVLPHLGGLTHIHLEKTQHIRTIWDTLDELGEKCPLLENVTIIGFWIDNATLMGLAAHCENLVQLDLSESGSFDAFSKGGLPNLLEKRPGIKTLDITDTWWCCDVDALVKRFPNVLIRG